MQKRALGSSVQDAGCRMQDAGCRMQDTGCRVRVGVQEIGCGVWVCGGVGGARCEMRGARCKARMLTGVRDSRDASDPLGLAHVVGEITWMDATHGLESQRAEYALQARLTQNNCVRCTQDI